MTGLIPIESVNPIALFTDKGIDELLAQIEAEVSTFVPDLSTAKSRNEIKSIAYKVTLSKGVIDRAGADLVADWKSKAKVVDSSRLKARKFLDDLAERERIASAERAENERIAAAERAERDKQAAIDAERKRQVEQEAMREAVKLEADLARQKNVDHCRKINNLALAALKANGIDEELAKQVIRLVKAGKIPHMTMVY